MSLTTKPFRYPTCSPEPRGLVVIDLSRDRMDGQIAACCLQGLVNRAGADKVYVHHSWCFDNRGGGATQVHVARSLLDMLYRELPTEHLAPADDVDWPGFLSMWERYAEHVTGLIIWDPGLAQATIEAATTIAGQTGALPVSPALARELCSRGAEVQIDLRDQRFLGNVAVLEWLLDRYFADANHEVAFTWSHMTTGADSWGAANKDYVVAHRLFSFYLNIFDEDERSHYADVVRQYPPGTPIMGWTDELVADQLFAGLGYFMVPYISVENLTVHSAFPSLDASGRQPMPGPASWRDGCIYASMQLCDGDNLLHSMVYQVDAAANDPDFGTEPATWILNPALVDLAPRLYDWYLERLRSSGQEAAAMLGDGHPSAEKSRGLKRYGEMARHYMHKAGMHTVKVMAESEALAWNIRPRVMLGGYHGGDHRAADPAGYHFDGRTFHIDTTSPDNGLERIKALVEQWPADQPLFLTLFGDTAKRPGICGHLKQLAGRLRVLAEQADRPIELVTAAELAATYAEALRAGRLTPVIPNDRAPEA